MSLSGLGVHRASAAGAAKASAQCFVTLGIANIPWFGCGDGVPSGNPLHFLIHVLPLLVVIFTAFCAVLADSLADFFCGFVLVMLLALH